MKLDEQIKRPQSAFTKTDWNLQAFQLILCQKIHDNHMEFLQSFSPHRFQVWWQSAKDLWLSYSNRKLKHNNLDNWVKNGWKDLSVDYHMLGYKTLSIFYKHNCFLISGEVPIYIQRSPACLPDGKVFLTPSNHNPTVLIKYLRTNLMIKGNVVFIIWHFNLLLTN